MNDTDLLIEWYSGTGAGGQHRNKHQNSCRITHLPTGTVATAQTRSRQSSLQLAREDVYNRLQAAQSSSAARSTAVERKQQVGSGMRGDKVRTYRFSDDIVTDHNTGKKASVRKVMSGNFDLFW